MQKKKSLVFKSATILALLIALGVLVSLIYFIFSGSFSKISNSEIAYIVILILLLFAAIVFQIQNLFLLGYANNQESSLPNYIKYHTIALFSNVIGTIGVGMLLYSMIFDFYGSNTNKSSTSFTLLGFCGIWFCSNLVSIIGAIHIRSFLRSLTIKSEGTRVENFLKK